MKQKINISLISAILVSAVLIALVHNYFYTKGIPYIRKSENIQWADSTQFNDNVKSKTAEQFFSEIPPEKTHYISDAGRNLNKPKLQLINLKQTYNLFNIDSVVFVDARDKWDFAEGHIPGAINIPYYNFNKDNVTLKNVPIQKTIVVYCEGDDCEASLSLAKELQKLEYKVIYVFSGGWGEWIKAGYKIEKSVL